jgi:hypothetical protein
MKNSNLTKTLVAAVTIVALTVLGGSALASELMPIKSQKVEQPKPYCPFVDQHFPQKVLFGDTHFHSRLSVDSGMIGNTLGLDDAFRFSRGEEIVTSTGQRAKLIRPLDFLVLADHAEYLGIADLLATEDPALLATEAGKKFRRKRVSWSNSRNPIPPTWINTSPSGCSSAIPTFTPRCLWTAA